MPANAMDRIDVLRAARGVAGSMLLGLDFDGTIAPIVPRPEGAGILPAAREALTTLAGRRDMRIALVSGRALDDLRHRVDVAGVYYAGNHGLEIDGPDVHLVNQEAVAAQGTLAQLTRALRDELSAIDGVRVENKTLTLTVHFRMVDDEALSEHVRGAVRACAAAYNGVRLTDGRKVVEIRPDVDWHKGRAFRFLRDTLEQRFGRGPAIFIGDDRTDEDAFRELGEMDCSIVVGDPPQHESIAHASLRSPDEVAAFLHRLTTDHG